MRNKIIFIKIWRPKILKNCLDNLLIRGCLGYSSNPKAKKLPIKGKKKAILTKIFHINNIKI